MVARIFWYKIVRVPTYLGKRGSPIFLDLNVFADGTFLYQFEIRIRIKKREDHFVSPNSLFLAACVGRLYEFVLYNSYKNCLNWYKNHAVYEFVLYNLYNNCMNLSVWIRTKISYKNCIVLYEIVYRIHKTVRLAKTLECLTETICPICSTVSTTVKLSKKYYVLTSFLPTLCNLHLKKYHHHRRR